MFKTLFSAFKIKDVRRKLLLTLHVNITNMQNS